MAKKGENWEGKYKAQKAANTRLKKKIEDIEGQLRLSGQYHRWYKEEEAKHEKTKQDLRVFQERAVEVEGDLAIAEATITFLANFISRTVKEFQRRFLDLRGALRALDSVFNAAFHAVDSNLEGGDLPSGKWVQGSLISRCEDIGSWVEGFHGKGYRDIIREELDRKEDEKEYGHGQSSL